MADDPEERGGRPARPFPTSLCHRCGACRYVEGKASVFVLCSALAVKYPPQPVVRCAAFREREGERG